MIPEKSEKVKKIKIFNTSTMIWKILNRKEKRWFVTISFMMFLGMLLEMLSLSLAIPTIAILMNPEQLNKYHFVETIFSFLIDSQEIKKDFMVLSGLTLLLLLHLFKTIYLTFLTWNQAIFAYSVQSTVSKTIFSKYMRQDYSFHLKRNSAQLIQNIIGEVGLFTIAVQSKLILITELLVLFGVVILLLIVQPVGTAVILTMMLTFGLLYYFTTKKKNVAWGKEMQVHEGYKIQHIQQGLGGIKDVKITGREELFIESYNIHNIKVAKIGGLATTIKNIPRVWLDLLAVIAVVALVFIYLRMETPLEEILPSVALFIAAAFRILPSGGRILNAKQGLNYTSAAVLKLSDEINLPEPVEVMNHNKIIDFNDSIDLKNIHFSYLGVNTPVIEDLSLSIKKGEFVGIIGRSGSGKTTLIDLILGFLNADDGLITVDGQEIKYNVKNWRKQIGYVSQDIVLIDGSIKENIAFGLPIEKIDNEKLLQAIKMAQLEDFINELPDKLDTNLGERGVKISGGQKQRIGVARALYSDPEILILDEATSSLDTRTEKELMKSIIKLKSKKTIIAVAHRASTLLDCDRIIELQNKGSVENLDATLQSH